MAAETLTIRLEERDREVLEAAAQRKGTGLSGFIRGLAEAEAARLRREAILEEGKRVVAYLSTHPAAREELETYGTPIDELPSEPYDEHQAAPIVVLTSYRSPFDVTGKPVPCEVPFFDPICKLSAFQDETSVLPVDFGIRKTPLDKLP